MPVDSETGTEPSFALWASREYGGPARTELVVAAWPDGRVITSEDSLRGGPPYFFGLVPPARVERARERLLEATSEPGTQMAIPDAACRHLFVSADGPDRELSSAIEFFEAGPGLVATDHGIEPLGDRDRESVIAAQSPEHRAARAAWSRSVEILGDLAADARTPYAEADPVRWVWRAP